MRAASHPPYCAAELRGGHLFLARRATRRGRVGSVEERRPVEYPWGLYAQNTCSAGMIIVGGIAVPEEFLNRGDAVPVFEQVDHERVPEGCS